MRLILACIAAGVLIAATAVTWVIWGWAYVGAALLVVACGWLVRSAWKDCSAADAEEWQVSDATMDQLKRVQRRARMESGGL